MVHDDNKDTAVDKEQTSVTDNNKDDGNHDAPIQAGDLTRKLKTCRERAGLTTEQAAIEMRLSPAIVRALENEQFDDLPDPPYVRGYLRSYARLDDSDSQSLINTYETLRGGPTTPLHTTTAPTQQAAYYYQQQQSAKSRMSPTGLKVLSLLGLVLLLGLLLFVPGVAEWAGNVWQSFSGKPQTVAVQDDNTSQANNSTASNVSAQGSMAEKPDPTMPATSPLQDQPEDTTTDDADDNGILVWADETEAEANNNDNSGNSTPSAEVTATTETDATTIGLADGEEQLIPSPTDAATNDDPLIPNLDAERDNAETLADRLAAAQADADAEEAAAAEATNNVAANQSSSSTDTADNEAAQSQQSSRNDNASTDTTASNPSPSSRQQPIDGTVRVRVEFYDDAWMQVKEGGGRTIFEALNEANTWKEFKYSTPLSFKIGNANNVKLYLNGQLYNTAPHVQGSVASFTIN